jgi:hypothetical protein
VGEFTTSSTSVIHYGHYKTSTHITTSSKIHMQQLPVTVRSGVYPSRWNVTLQVMLEKSAGVCLMENLRYIQLYEVNVVFFQNFMFREEPTRALTENSFLPEEYFSQKGSTAEDATFDKRLTADLSCQALHPSEIVSVDAAQRYDIINHVIVSLMWLALIRQLGLISVVLSCLQTMHFFPVHRVW